MSSIYRTAYLDDGVTPITDAKQRLVVNVAADGGPGVNKPQRIVCAEPSPDVAQALSTAISASLQADASRTGADGSNQAASGSGAFGRSAAASVAQLGERLGTIQLLRDGLYRTCEAFANGAITETMYAVITSRIDDTITTLLSTEVAGGAFGRQLAGLSGEASASAGQLAASLEELKTLREERRSIEAEIAGLRKDLEDQTGDEAAATRRKIAVAQANLNNVNRDMREAQGAAASAFSSSQAVAGIGTIRSGSGSASSDPASAVTQIHRQFMNNDNMDAMLVACITTLDRSPGYSGRRRTYAGPAADIPGSRPAGGPASGHYDEDGGLLPETSQFADVCRELFQNRRTAKGYTSTFLELVKAKQEHSRDLAVIEARQKLYALIAAYDARCSSTPDKTAEATCRAIAGILRREGIDLGATSGAIKHNSSLSSGNGKLALEGDANASLPISAGSLEAVLRE